MTYDVSFHNAQDYYYINQILFGAFNSYLVRLPNDIKFYLEIHN